jgi:uncharacterized membrane protein YraQ (UPF0718 family)
MEQIIKIADFIFRSFLHIWPYLLVTIPLAVVVNITGASKYINKALTGNPVSAVFLATVVGAFSPFCSCGVIPVITSLLIGGVPLAPVMSFWIASPSMDPEIFFLSTSVLGLKLSVWRLASTFLISLSAGYITHYATKSGFIGKEVLRSGTRPTLINLLRTLVRRTYLLFKYSGPEAFQMSVINAAANQTDGICCSSAIAEGSLSISSCVINSEPVVKCNGSCRSEQISFRSKLMKEIWNSTWLVLRFMSLAFLLTALIKFYVPEKFITGILSKDSPVSVLIATLVGIPAYTSNMTALPFVGALIDLGMNKGAALAFLIAGATTTLPAMAAVWGIAKPRVFMLYLSFAFFGALLTGILYNLFNI